SSDSGRVRGLQCFENLGEHAVCISQDVIVPETDHSIPFALQPRRASYIAGAIRMLTAIEFDDQPAIGAKKIDNVMTDRHLSPKLKTEKGAVAQSHPETFFRFGLIDAQTACARDVLPSHKAPHPALSPMGRG